MFNSKYSLSGFDLSGLTPEQKSIFEGQMQLLNESNRLGYNVPTMRLGLEGLGSLASGYTAYKGLQQAKDQFNFQKKVTETNMANSVKDYNRQMYDRIDARAAQNNMAKAQVDEYKKLNKLSGL